MSLPNTTMMIRTSIIITNSTFAKISFLMRRTLPFSLPRIWYESLPFPADISSGVLHFLCHEGFLFCLLLCLFFIQRDNHLTVFTFDSDEITTLKSKFLQPQTAESEHWYILSVSVKFSYCKISVFFSSCHMHTSDLIKCGSRMNHEKKGPYIRRCKVPPLCHNSIKAAVLRAWYSHCPYLC